MFFDIMSSCCLQKHHLHSGFHPVCSIQSSCSAEHPSEKNSHIAAHSNCSAYVQRAGLVVSTTHMTFNRTCCGRIVFTTLVTHTRRTHIRHHGKRAHQETKCDCIMWKCVHHLSISLFDLHLIGYVRDAILHVFHIMKAWTFVKHCEHEVTTLCKGIIFLCKQTVAMPLILVAGAIGS